MNGETEVLGLASRIKRPIPLAALAVLILGMVALAIIRSGAAQIGTLGYAIIGIVALVALVTLIVALIIAKPARVTIKTGGEYSPGDIGGDYSVNHAATPSQSKRPASTEVRNPPPRFPATSIETKGSHSPGRVGGDYSVHEDSED
jgi:hypothetical protein